MRNAAHPVWQLDARLPAQHSACVARCCTLYHPASRCRECTSAAGEKIPFRRDANGEVSRTHFATRYNRGRGAGGRWHGRQIVSASWVKESLARQSSVDDTDYGYFWWRPYLNVQTPRRVERVTMNAAQGNGGQKIYIVPQFDFVGVFTGGDYNSSGAPPNKIIIQLVLPALIAAYANRAN